MDMASKTMFTYTSLGEIVSSKNFFLLLCLHLLKKTPHIDVAITFSWPRSSIDNPIFIDSKDDEEMHDSVIYVP